MLRRFFFLRTVNRLHSKHFSTSLQCEEADYNFGSYDVILPEEPYKWGVAHIPHRPVPAYIPRPHYALSPPGEAPSSPRIVLGSEDELNLRKAAGLAKSIRDMAGAMVKPGITTNCIDEAVHAMTILHNAYPSPLKFDGFPRSVCTSVNNVITHGIPDDRPLQNGDLVTIDVTIYLNGFHGDTARTYLVGDVDAQGRDLAATTNAAREAGIQACGPGRPYKGIGKAIQESLGERTTGFTACISQQFTGHGIGTLFHKPPWIFHTVNDEPERMVPGDCFTIEPAMIQGTDPTAWIFPDGWTASTVNCARAAQSEDQILITETGVEILTQ